MVEDKRGYARFPFSKSVEYIHSDVTINGSVASNVSLSGISLKVQEFIPMGTCLELQVRLGTSPQVVWIKAQVVRICEISSEGYYEVGLKFLKDEACIRAVGKYIKSNINQ